MGSLLIPIRIGTGLWRKSLLRRDLPRKRLGHDLSVLHDEGVAAFSFGRVTGFLKATAVATSLVNIASDVTGILPIANGGTGTSTTPTYGKVLLGNASGSYDLVATSFLGRAVLPNAARPREGSGDRVLGSVR